ncbi:MAG: DNA alkylation repair protein [Clostridia bacterium]|nr:DNA alkylation repair protein [Clostridia bacterium]
MSEIVKSIRKQMIENSSEQARNGLKRFFKDELSIYGLKSAVISKIAKDNYQLIKEYNKKDIFDLCSELWESGYLEETFIACNWAYKQMAMFTEDDLDLFETWIKNHINNWASCDSLCNHTIGSYFEMFPHKVSKLLEWTKSDNRWVRRAAAVSLIIPARKGLFKKEIFDIAEALLMDKDDMVQKGYGWMLKSAAENDVEAVYQFVLSKRKVMPRTALRYAIEKMPMEKKAEAMKKI